MGYIMTVSIEKELFDESTSEIGQNGCRLIRSYLLRVDTNPEWGSGGSGIVTQASGTAEPAAYRNLEAACGNTIPNYFDHEVYYPFGSSGDGYGKSFNLTCVRIWTQPLSNEVVRVNTEWIDNSGIPLHVNSGFILQGSSTTSIVQWNHDIHDSGIKVSYVPAGQDPAKYVGTKYNPMVTVPKHLAHGSRVWVGIAGPTSPWGSPQDVERNIRGCVDTYSRTWLCNQVDYRLRPDGNYDIRIGFIESPNQEGWDAVKLWTDEKGYTPGDIASGLTSTFGWENGPLDSGTKSGNGWVRPAVYDTFWVISGSGTGWDSASNLPYHIADVFEYPLPA